MPSSAMPITSTSSRMPNGLYSTVMLVPFPLPACSATGIGISPPTRIPALCRSSTSRGGFAGHIPFENHGGAVRQCPGPDRAAGVDLIERIGDVNRRRVLRRGRILGELDEALDVLGVGRGHRLGLLLLRRRFHPAEQEQ